MPNTHRCAHPACRVLVATSKLACPPHWWSLPEELRHNITVAYRRRAANWRPHALAVGEAMKWWRAQQAKATEAAS